MNDRELLMAAAKAIGLTRIDIKEVLRPAEDMTDDPMPIYVSGYREDGACVFDWNPLTGDGDALRLAKTLGFTVDFDTGVVRNAIGDILAISEVDIRLAIVRAAAEIGSRATP